LFLSIPCLTLASAYMYYMSQNGATPGLNLVNLINQGILSIAAATAGNGATALIQIQTCFSSILMGADSTQTSSCFVRQGGPISTLETIVISIVRPAAPTFISSLFSFHPPHSSTLDLELSLPVSSSRPDNVRPSLFLSHSI
jgi:hypothetical protein